MADMGDSFEIGFRKCKGSDPLQDLSIGGSVPLKGNITKWNVMIWTGCKYIFGAYFVFASRSVVYF
jgi:hypothetical protein